MFQSYSIRHFIQMHAQKGGIIGFAAVIPGVLTIFFKLKTALAQHIAGGCIGSSQAGTFATNSARDYQRPYGFGIFGFGT